MSAAYWIYVRCNRCKEVLRARVDLYNDLSLDYDAPQAAYFCRKVLMGTSRRFQQIEVTLKIRPEPEAYRQPVTGGQLITREEYEQYAPNVV